MLQHQLELERREREEETAQLREASEAARAELKAQVVAERGGGVGGG